MPIDCRAWTAALWVSAALLAGGCASVPHSVGNPPGWVFSREVSQPNGCPDVTGAYSTRAADAYPQSAGDTPALNEIFELRGRGAGIFQPLTPDRHWPTLTGATMASFSSDGGSLCVRFRDDLLGVVTLKFSRIHFISADRDSDAFYHCGESELGSALRFVGPRTRIRGWPYLFAEDDIEILSLFKAADGSLIVNCRTDRLLFTSLLLGSQVHTKSSVWWRYPPVESKDGSHGSERRP